MSKEKNNKEEKEKSPFEQMAEDISMIKTALDTLHKLGITKELMTIYIKHKTRLPTFKINAVLEAQKDFLDNAIKKK